MDSEAKQKRAVQLAKKKKLGGKKSKKKIYRKDRRCSCDFLEKGFSAEQIAKYGKTIKKHLKEIVQDDSEK